MRKNFILPGGKYFENKHKVCYSERSGLLREPGPGTATLLLGLFPGSYEEQTQVRQGELVFRLQKLR